MTTVLTVLSVVFSYVVIACYGTRYESCESPMGELHEFYISVCNVSDICRMARGTTGSIYISFTPHRRCDRVVTSVHVQAGWITLPIPLNNPLACSGNVKCPLKEGVTYDYIFNVTVDNAVPDFTGRVRWEIQDERGSNMACVKFMAGVH